MLRSNSKYKNNKKIRSRQHRKINDSKIKETKHKKSSLFSQLKSSKPMQVDLLFLGTIIILLMFGLIMVTSSSSESARYMNNDPLFFAKRQFIWAIISVIVMMVVSKVDYKFIKDKSFLILGISILLLIAIFVVGQKVNGSTRWINLGFLTFQPSEFAKLALITFLASSLSRNQDKLPIFTKGLLPHLAIVGFIAALIVLEPHFSATLLIVGTSIIMIYVAGAKLKHLLLLAAPVVAGGIAMVIISPYRLQRVTSFMDPFKDKLGDGWQIIQSLYAIGSGGLFGLGLGQSRQKFLYIPEPHNDFIFSILCEELGTIGAFLMIVLFIVLIWRGIRIAMKAPDTFSCLFVTGIISMVALEVIMNIAVVTSSMPVTGIPLPFFSYGGTSLLFLMTGMGIVLNISRYVERI